MKSVSFNITEEEIREKSGRRLNPAQLKKVLQYIENDEGIWSAIDGAIEASVQEALKDTGS